MRCEQGRGLGKDKSRNYLLWEFDSIGDIVEQSRLSDGKGGSSRTVGNAAWYGTDSWDEAADLAMNGWRGPSATVHGVLEAVRERLATVDGEHTVRTLDMFGEEPNIDLFLQGEVECMYDQQMRWEPHDGKVFTMIIDGTSRSDIEPSDTLARGAALCGLVEAMNLLGYSMDIYVEHTWTLSRYHNDPTAYFTLLAQVAHAGDPFDINRVMFAIGHPAWNRRIAFGTAESIEKMWNGGFSASASARGMNGCHFAERVGASVQVSLNTIKRRTDPLQWVLDQLEAQGVWEP